jgi:hypothetical protein
MRCHQRRSAEAQGTHSLVRLGSFSMGCWAGGNLLGFSDSPESLHRPGSIQYKKYLGEWILTHMDMINTVFTFDNFFLLVLA